MRVDADVERAGLLHFGPDRPVRIYVVNRDAAWIAVCDQQVTGGAIARDVYRARTERCRRTVRMQRAGRVDAKSGDPVLITARRDARAGVTRAAVTPGDVEEWTG